MAKNRLQNPTFVLVIVFLFTLCKTLEVIKSNYNQKVYCHLSHGKMDMVQINRYMKSHTENNLNLHLKLQFVSNNFHIKYFQFVVILNLSITYMHCAKNDIMNRTII